MTLLSRRGRLLPVFSCQLVLNLWHSKDIINLLQTFVFSLFYLYTRAGTSSTLEKYMI